MADQSEHPGYQIFKTCLRRGQTLTLITIQRDLAAVYNESYITNEKKGILNTEYLITYNQRCRFIVVWPDEKLVVQGLKTTQKMTSQEQTERMCVRPKPHTHGHELQSKKNSQELQLQC